MEETKTETKIETTTHTTPQVAQGVAPVTSGSAYVPRGGNRGGDRNGARGGRDARGGAGKGGRGNGRPRPVREKPEFETKTISVRRVTRVVAGGRRFSLAVAIVAGDRNGRIGLGTGKATDTQLAIEKATKQAKKNMITLKLTKNKSIPHDVAAKYNSAEVTMMPNKGRGLIAGSSARIILALAGVKDITTKFHSGSKNKLNNARATMKALQGVAYAYGEAPVEAVKPIPAPEVVAAVETK